MLLDLLATAVAIAVIAQYSWSMRGHFSSKSMPRGALVIAIVVLVLFGRGKIAGLMGEVGKGITSFKLFMAYPGVFYSDDGQIFRAMQKAAENGGTIMMHAENGIAIDVLTRTVECVTLPEHFRLFHKNQFGIGIVFACPLLNLITQISGDEYDLAGLQLHDTVEHVRHHRLTGHGDQRLGLAPRVRS